jgi:D-glycero-D-manno-heptose 1,7-bisphosphate phosphatase
VTSRPAVFIDRDGTLTEEVGYVNHPSRLQRLPRAGEAICRLNAANVAAVLVARGHFSDTVLRTVDEPLHAPLARARARRDLDAVDRVLARPVAA